MTKVRGAYQPLNENPDLRWFERTATKCSRCRRAEATGILRGARNESFGPHCDQCAKRRLRDAERVRDGAFHTGPAKGGGP